MSEDRTAEAALAIETYVKELGAELSVLKDGERRETVGEIREMLLDAAKADPAQAFAEMERMGAPAQLAAALLEERGVLGGHGLPAVPWWRAAIAAAIDAAIALGPVILFGWIVVQGILGAMRSAELTTATRVWEVMTLAAVGVLVVVVEWRYFSPWRTGETDTTVGMVLTGTAGLRAGGRTRLVTVDALRSAGLPTPTRTPASASVIFTLLVTTAIWAALSGTVRVGPPSQLEALTVLAPSATTAGGMWSATDAAERLYNAAAAGARDDQWPATTGDAGLDVAAFKKAFDVRISTVESLSDPQETAVSPTLHEVTVREMPGPSDAWQPRDVVLTYHLRLDWPNGTDAQPTWVLAGYRVAGENAAP